MVKMAKWNAWKSPGISYSAVRKRVKMLRSLAMRTDRCLAERESAFRYEQPSINSVNNKQYHHFAILRDFWTSQDLQPVMHFVGDFGTLRESRLPVKHDVKL
jgi:hypothetical protein